MRRFVNSYTVTGAASLLLSGFVANYLRNIPFAPLRAGLGPAFFPTVVSVILGAMGIAALIIGIVRAVRQPDAMDLAPLTNRTAVLVCIVVLYAAGIQLLGVLLPTAVFLLVAMLSLGVNRYRAVLATALASGAIYIIFGILFRIRLF